MDNKPTPTVPSHVQVEDNKKPEKKYVIFHNLNAKENEAFYVSVNGALQAFAKVVELKSQGATKVTVFQQVELKISVH